MKIVSVIVLCSLLPIAVCALGQVQSNTNSPPAVAAMLPYQVATPDQALAVTSPELVSFTSHWNVRMTTEPIAPELWRIDYTMDSSGRHSAGPVGSWESADRQNRHERERNPLGPKLNVDRQNKI